MNATRTMLLVAALAGTMQAQAQGVDLSFLATRAEATGFEQTSRYEDVMAFVEVAAASSERLHLTHFGYSMEGRALPLVVFGDVLGARPEDVLGSGKTRVFIQANIHAGEVCGKEAALMLLRALAAGQHAPWADSLVVLIAPIYNADGNERVSLLNRPLQHGPVGGMGQRANAQGLDLNRDHMKLDAPEARSLVRLFNAYDPHVVIDLHTTNGTYHAYHLTYAPPLHPDTPAAIDALLRQDWLPRVTERIRARYGWEYYYYGNMPELDAGYYQVASGDPMERGWYTFDHRPRFNNNYVGLRNRFAILSEAYAYATFEERILATLYFLEELLDYAHRHAGAVRQIVDAADAQSVVGMPLTVRARPARSADEVAVLLGEVVQERNPFSGAVMLRRTEVQRPVRVPEYGAFAARETAVAPRAYLVPAALEAVADRLTAHGVTFQTLRADTTARVERFRIDSARVAEQPFQGHRQRTLYGAYEAAQADVPAGTLLVPVDQPLGRLAFALLEPRSDDGVANWGLMDETLQGAAIYPVLRLPAGP